jgi:iron(III) transport system permease protein
MSTAPLSTPPASPPGSAPRRPRPAGQPANWLIEPFRHARRMVTAWRARRRVSPAWTIAVALVVLVLALPLVSVLALALAPKDNIWPHLAANVLPGALWTTFWLLVGVAVLTAVTGAGTAWLVTMYRFPGRDMVSWLLLLPLAMPTYILAMCASEMMDFTGPLQSGLRALFGWTSARDYWFPEIRSLPGAIFVVSAVLYPYVYLTARASFLQQSACALEVARTLGRAPWGVFWEVALPLARPALAAGVTLVLMETLNDIGAVQHLGVRTLTVSVYDTWLQRGNLGGAAQIATIMLACVLLVMAAERMARGKGRYHQTTGHYRAIPFAKLRGVKGRCVLMVCLLPAVVGFFLPVGLLLVASWRHAHAVVSGPFWSAAWHSVLLAAIAAGVAVALGLLLAYARRVAGNGFTRPAVRLAGFGYAVPGTVLAVGLLIPLAGLDNWIDDISRRTLGISTGLLLSGTIAALVLAHAIRFLAVALGALEEGLGRISPNLDAAARTLGATALSTLARVHVPLLRPAVGAAALLVFVDSMKELPATLLLRPFNFETLATHVYGFAALEQFPQAGLAALMIVLIGLAPVLLLHRAIIGGRAGGVLGEE